MTNLKPGLRSLAAFGLLLAACGHDAYYFHLHAPSASFDAAVMTALETEAKSLGLVLHPWNERVARPGVIVSTLTTGQNDPVSLEVILSWYANASSGSSGFGVTVGSRAEKGLQGAKPRIDDVADHLRRILESAYGAGNVTVELRDGKMWIF